VKVVYWSSKSENTHRFVQKLNIENIRLPLNGTCEIEIDEPFILILPSYGDTVVTAIPKVVNRFLANKNNSSLMRGVIGGGNTDFGSKFCIAAKVISHFFKTRLLYQFEISGTPTDVLNVQEIIQKQIRIENESNS
jgi:protein involved in ribonucleotide reduction